MTTSKKKLAPAFSSDQIKPIPGFSKYVINPAGNVYNKSTGKQINRKPDQPNEVQIFSDAGPRRRVNVIEMLEVVFPTSEKLPRKKATPKEANSPQAKDKEADFFLKNAAIITALGKTDFTAGEKLYILCRKLGASYATGGQIVGGYGHNQVSGLIFRSTRDAARVAVLDEFYLQAS